MVSTEYSYYVYTENVSAKEGNNIIRKHWSIENTQNHVRDEIMDEDKSRIRVKPVNMMILRSFALNTLRIKGVENVKQTLYKNSLNLDTSLLFYQFTMLELNSPEKKTKGRYVGNRLITFPLVL